MRAPSKELTLDEVVARIDSGMTVGIGGWGSRRKPMALVRAILRSDLTDLHVVSYAGPDVGLLLAAGKASRVTYAFATLDSIPLEPWFSQARQEGTAQFREWDEGMFQTGLRAAAQRVPFLPMRAGLGSSVLDNDPDLRTVVSPYDDARGAGRRAGADARRGPRPHESRGRARQRPVPRPRSLLRRPVLHGSQRGLRVDRADHRLGRADRRRTPAEPAAQPHDGHRRGRDAERRALHDLHPELRAGREVPEGLRHRREVARGLGCVRRAVPLRRRSRLPVRGGGIQR